MSPTEAARPAGSRRRGEAGLTLVEVLVALALVGILAGAVGLSLGPTTSGDDAQAEADMLAARMRRASEEALLAGQAVGIVWTERDYRFVALANGTWAPHPIPLLGEPRPLAGGVRFKGEGARGGAFAVTADDLPVGERPLELRLGAEDENPARAVAVTWDGATATVTSAGPGA